MIKANEVDITVAVSLISQHSHLSYALFKIGLVSANQPALAVFKGEIIGDHVNLINIISFK